MTTPSTTPKVKAALLRKASAAVVDGAIAVVFMAALFGGATLVRPTPDLNVGVTVSMGIRG